MSDLLNVYRDALNNPPDNGTILTTIDGSPITLTVLLASGKPPFVYTHVYLSEELNDKIGWYLQEAVGWKCILLPKARRNALKRCSDEIIVKSLKVIRVSRSENSLLCEVHEYY